MKILISTIFFALLIPFASAQNVCLFFTQTKTIAMLDEKIQSRGFLLSDGVCARWQTVQPFGSALVFDGQSAEQFELEDGVWRKVQTPSGFAATLVKNIMKLSGGDFSGELYSVRRLENCTVLTPKLESAKKFVSEIVVYGGAMRGVSKIVVKDPSGDLTETVFTDLIENPAGVENAYNTKNFTDVSPRKK